MDVASLILVLLWPLLLIGFFKSRKKIFLAQSYLSIAVGIAVSLIYAITVFRSYLECMNEDPYQQCAALPQALIEWYGEWSLIINVVVLGVFVVAHNKIQVAKNDKQI
ncbi:hypothetical protein M5M_13075 [Simiduia agarivorans SA1 = DSM 21679]|uniref:Uncharacterized protein n=1 Tax=Simiduia agarivorans (strain DSM 21679 / JCM 13881 / BCRC 17597 / SA1) TaxID=1117647 RepID=K4KL76_SIMAS|nr:hypothetical protein M5M_13075 [Simiduia agarivorans SA1 = DSM 21679]